MKTFDELREVALEKIEQAFPKNRHFDSLTSKSADSYHQARLNEFFKDESWEEFVDNPHIIYNMSDIDHVMSFSDEAYRYCLPAFFITELHDPGQWIYVSSVLEKIIRMLPKFSKEQLEALLASLACCLQWHREESAFGGISYEYYVDTFEDAQLRIMMRLNELGK